MKTKITATAKSHNKHVYRQTLSTTSDFAHVQPIFFRPMLAKSTLNANIKQFVRLMPLPFPTFGKIKLCNAARFVPIEQVYPAYAALMSEKEYLLPDGTSYIPKYMPTVKIQALTYSMLSQYAESTVFYNAGNGPMDTAQQLCQTLFDLKMALAYMKVGQVCCPREMEVTGINGEKETITVGLPIDAELRSLLDRLVEAKDNETAESLNTEYQALMKKRGFNVGNTNDTIATYPTDAQINAADYIARTTGGAMGDDFPYNNLVLYRFGSRMRSLMKIFYGLGIQLSLDDYTDINVLPLAAWYKAYFDRFFPTRNIDWMATKTYRFIKWVEENDITDYSSILAINGFSSNAKVTTLRNYFYAMTNEIANCFVTSDLDYLAAQTRSIANGQSPSSYPLASEFGNHGMGYALNYTAGNDVAVLPSDIENTTPNQHNTNDTIPTVSSNTAINKWQLDLLKRMTNYVVKDSIIGNRIQLWMKAHLGEDVYNIIYHETTDCGYSETDITIGDIDSTADTAASGGAYLGSYAGKGLGSATLNIHYKANTFGYMFGFMWIQVETSWFQGTDAPLLAKSRFEFPNPEFDALGYEVTPRTTVWTDNGISFGVPSTYDNDENIVVTGGKQLYITNANGFGYMPRYSGWKYMKNIVNGDFRRRSMAHSMMPFYVDRMFMPRNIVHDEDSTSKRYTCGQYTLPLASEQWQYQDRYPWLSNYNRIFANSDSVDLNPYNGYTNTNPPDNFLIHQVTDVTEINFLKPLSQSYDVGNGIDMSVNRS